MKLTAGTTALALGLWAGIASAEPTRILIAAGSQSGLADERPLRHADADAARVGALMVDLGGVRAENTFVLAEPTRAALFGAIDRARAVASKQKPEEVTLLFYFSGHGDREALHVRDDRILLTELTAKLGEVPAALRIAITDACRTNREKGFVADEPFAITSTTSAQATGQVWIHASREGEAAQESDELDGAIFTHAWLNGLRGAADANGDSRVTLEESFAFAHSQTLIRSAKSSGVVQKPEAIVNLHELAPVVLTQTTQRLAILSLPAARDTHFLVYAADAKSVLSELWGLPERRIALAVPPGHYAVQRRFAGAGSVAQLALAAGEERALGDGDFHATSLEALASKGTADANEDAPRSGPPAETHHEISAGYGAGADTRTGLVQGPRADYAYAWSRVAITAGAEVDLAGRTLPTATERLVSGYGRAAVQLRVPLGPVALRLGAGGRAGWLGQRVEPRSGSVTTNGALVAGPEISVGVRGDVGGGFFVDLGATGDVVLVKEGSELRAVPGVVGAGALGARF